MSTTPQEKRQILRRMLEEPGIIVAPGCYDALTARMVERTGFAAAYVTGGGISRSLGYPDVGLITLTEQADRMRYIADSVSIPIIADADSGYGNAVNVIRAVREFERAGVAALHLEDEETPKKCALLADVGMRIPIVLTEEMVGKVRAAVEARQDPNLVVIARVCASVEEGLDDVIARANAYARAGADAVFLIHLNADQLREACARIDAPVMYNVSWHGSWVTSFPTLEETTHELERMGCKLAILSSVTALAGLAAMEKMLLTLKERGSAVPYFRGLDNIEDISKFYLLTGTEEVKASEARYLPGA